MVPSRGRTAANAAVEDIPRVEEKDEEVVVVPFVVVALAPPAILLFFDPPTTLFLEVVDEKNLFFEDLLSRSSCRRPLAPFEVAGEDSWNPGSLLKLNPLVEKYRNVGTSTWKKRDEKDEQAADEGRDPTIFLPREGDIPTRLLDLNINENSAKKQPIPRRPWFADYNSRLIVVVQI